MIHDQGLVDRLIGRSTESFAGTVFRATRVNADPTAPSINGGRWAPAPSRESGVFVLYTSVERDGAIAEMVSFFVDLTPMPVTRPVKVTTLAVTASKSLRLTKADLEDLGVDFSRYGERDYLHTQKIGGALAFLGLDGLLAPSARWPCDNLMIFTDNHKLAERLEPVGEEEVDWTDWAKRNGFISGTC